MARKRVLITGAAGYLSRQLLPVFREHYDVVLLDRHKPHDIDDII
jgi:nucleoside-diphosphate-sugar epimerase